MPLVTISDELLRTLTAAAQASGRTLAAELEYQILDAVPRVVAMEKSVAEALQLTAEMKRIADDNRRRLDRLVNLTASSGLAGKA
jgi:hypothetical protein